MRKDLTIDDVRAERNRYRPIVTQEHLAIELGWPEALATLVEAHPVQLTQDQLQAMLEAILRVVAKRAE